MRIDNIILEEREAAWCRIPQASHSRLFPTQGPGFNETKLEERARGVSGSRGTKLINPEKKGPKENPNVVRAILCSGLLFDGPLPSLFQDIPVDMKSFIHSRHARIGTQLEKDLGHFSWVAANIQGSV